jgi:hypothetical protein
MGAIMAAALRLTRPELLAGAILFRALSPFRDDQPPSLAGTPVLIIEVRRTAAGLPATMPVSPNGCPALARSLLTTCCRRAIMAMDRENASERAAASENVLTIWGRGLLCETAKQPEGKMLYPASTATRRTWLNILMSGSATACRSEPSE